MELLTQMELYTKSMHIWIKNKRENITYHVDHIALKYQATIYLYQLLDNQTTKPNKL